MIIKVMMYGEFAWRADEVSFAGFIVSVEINEDRPKENRKRPFTLSLPERRSQPPSLVFWQRLKGRQRSETAVEWNKGRLPVCPDGGCWHGGL